MKNLTKDELKAQLAAGKTLDELFDFRSGQECEIFKAKKFPMNPVDFDKIIYIPDLALNELHPCRPCTDEEEIEDTLYNCYTANDFIEATDGDLQQAEALFYFCDWQTPSAAADEDGFFD